MRSPIEPDSPQVTAALAKLHADPNLSAEKSVSVLRWAERSHPDAPSRWYEWVYDLFRWLGDLFGWLAQSGRVLMWVAAALLAALLAIYLFRLLRRHDLRRDGATFKAPTHVRELDIRPESLPANIGATAWVLWERGDERAALALLYRGLLSRLVHAHQVPIRDSSTEGDCLVLARRHASRGAGDFAARVIPVWQRAVYGAQRPLPSAIRELCEEFSRALDPAVTADDASQPA